MEKEKIEYEKNKELKEKQDLQLDFEKAKNEEKKKLLNHEHILKMERLNKQEELTEKIAKLTGQDTDDLI